MDSVEQQTLFESLVGHGEAPLKDAAQVPRRSRVHFHAFVGEVCWYPGCGAKKA